MRLYQVEMLFLLWFVPLLLGLYVYAAHQRKKSLVRFVDAGLLGRLNTQLSLRRRWGKAVLLLVAYVFIILGLARPAWNPKPRQVERQGRDVVFMLDVSKSMLAEDLAPNRLERAKLAILDCLETLQGDRVGLIAFAGAAAVKCPLTLDYAFFRSMVEDISVNSITRGGTLIGDAIRMAVDQVFDEQEKQYKDIVLITDGEDHDSFPVQAAETAAQSGIRILAIGLGDETQGQRIPITDENGAKTFLKYQGQEVWSKLDAATLRQMVEKTSGGQYLNVATGAFDLGKIYQDLIASAEKKSLEAQTITLYEEKFQIFLALAFAGLLMESMFTERRKQKP